MNFICTSTTTSHCWWGSISHVYTCLYTKHWINFIGIHPTRWLIKCQFIWWLWGRLCAHIVKLFPSKKRKKEKEKKKLFLEAVMPIHWWEKFVHPGHWRSILLTWLPYMTTFCAFIYAMENRIGNLKWNEKRN